MSMTLLYPMALAAMAAMIVPLILHIARKSEQQPTSFAALRWLRQKPRPRSRLRFDEWPLLLLRLMLIALVALMLARPVWLGSGSNSPYVAMVPGARIAPADMPGDAHWIAPGFPSLDQPPPAGAMPVASLIRQLDAELPEATPLTIIVPRQMAGADAEPMRLSRAVTWRIVDGEMPVAQAGPPPAARFAIRHDAAHREATRYVRAAALALKSAPDIAPPDAPLPDHGHSLIWLVGGSLPQALSQWVAQGGTAILAADALPPEGRARAPLWRDGDDAVQVEGLALGKGRLLRFTRPLTPSTMPALLEADFPDRLRNLLQPEAPAPTRVKAADYAPLTGGQPRTHAPQDMGPWLALSIALLFLMERWLATRRSRSVSP